MNLGEDGCDFLVWIELAQNRVEHSDEPSGFVKIGKRLSVPSEQLLKKTLYT
jgi:hypothetical protein